MRRQQGHSRLQSQDDGIGMTAMIDVVFLLLVFFIFTVKPTDILAALDVSRPGATDSPAIPTLRVDVKAGQFLLNGHSMPIERVEQYLARVAEFSNRQTVVVTCDSDSAHAQLVEVLDTCAKVGLRNVALMSR